MPLTKLRRPKFERSFIKQDLFSITLSQQRIHKLQRLLIRKKIDALLIITGIDSRFNIGNLNVINYILFDIFTTRRDDIQRSKLDDEIFDDIMICIQQNQVHVYCNGANYWLLLPYIASWSNLRLHCLSEEEMEDVDKLENFKMKTFVEITKGCNKIGVVTKCVNELDKQSTFNHMDIEHWPIVQTFGHDDFGRKCEEEKENGFFTMVHEVIDISADVYEILRQIDPVKLEFLYNKILPQIEGLFENIFQLLDTIRNNEKFTIDEALIEEPVLSYHNHLRRQCPENFTGLPHLPFTSVGINTRKQIIISKLSTPQSNDKLSDNPVEQKLTNPTHMIVQCVNVPNHFVESRTIFLQPHTKIEQSDTNVDNEKFVNLGILANAYNSIICAIDETIGDIKQASKIDLNKSKTESRLKEKLKNLKYDSYLVGINKDIDNEDEHGFMFVIHVVVFDLRNESGRNLGSVCFSDTFLVSSLPTNNASNINSVLRIGKNIPNYQYWSHLSLSKIHNVLNSTSNEQFINNNYIIDDVDLISPYSHFDECVINQTCCIFYKDRIVIFNKRIGPNIITPISVELFEGDSYDDWSFLVIDCVISETDAVNWIWISNDEKENKIILSFNNRSKLRKNLVNHIFPMWKESKIQITTKSSTELPLSFVCRWQLIQSYFHQSQHSSKSTNTTTSASIITSLSDDPHKSNLLTLQQSINSSFTSKHSCPLTLCQIMELTYSFRHFNNTYKSLVDIPSNTLTKLINNWQHHPLMCKSRLDNLIEQNSLEDALPESADNISCVVTILCGLPSNIQIQLANRISMMIKDTSNWILLQPLEIGEIKSQLSLVLKKYQLHSQTESSNKKDDSLDNIELEKQLRIIILSPPLLNSIDIVQSIPSILHNVNVIIGTICVCIDAKSAFIDDYECVVPGLLDSCNEGYCQCVLIIGGKIKKVESLQRMVRARNDYCSLLYCTNISDINKELDVILSPMAYQLPKQTQLRILAQNQPLAELIVLRYQVIQHLNQDALVKSIQDYSKGLIELKEFPRILFVNGLVQLEDSKQYNLAASTVASSVSLIVNKNIHKVTSEGDSTTNKLQSDLTKCIESPSHYLHLYIASKSKQYDSTMEQLKEVYRTKILNKFQKQLPIKKELLDRNKLTSTQIDEIHKCRHLESLPEGWFYNGVTYVNMDGSRCDKHPNLDQFIDEYLKKENKKISTYNMEIERCNFVSAFKC